MIIMHIRCAEVLSVILTIVIHIVSMCVFVQTTPVRKNGRDFVLGKKVMYKFDQLMCGLQQCERECVLRPMCKMIGYDRKSLTCSLSNYTATEDDPGNKQVFVSDPLHWIPPTELAEDCAGKCAEGETCFVYDGGRKTKCLITECTRMHIERATVSPESDVRVVGSSLSVSCVAGYEARGPNNSVTCHVDGSYKSNEFSCEVPCESPMTLTDGACLKSTEEHISVDKANSRCVSLNARLLQITAAKQARIDDSATTGTEVVLDGHYFQFAWHWHSLSTGPSESLNFLYGLNFTENYGPCILYVVGQGYKRWSCSHFGYRLYICEKA